MQLHRAVRRTTLRPGAKVGRVTEQLGERHHDADDLLPGPVVDVLDAAPARRDVTHHVAHELLGRGHLELHHGLEQHRSGPASGVLHGH